MRRLDFGTMPPSMLPLFLMPRYNVVIGAFMRERFAVMSAFRNGDDGDTNLGRQSALVDRVVQDGFGWFPLLWDWGDEVRRSIFIHEETRPATAAGRANAAEQAGGRTELSLDAANVLRRVFGLDRFIWGEQGRYLVYENDPPTPIAGGDKMRLSVDVGFLQFRERQS